MSFEYSASRLYVSCYADKATHDQATTPTFATADLTASAFLTQRATTSTRRSTAG